LYLTGPQQGETLTEIDGFAENTLVAWKWAVDHHRVGLLKKALNPLASYYFFRGRFEEFHAAFGYASERLSSEESMDVLQVRIGLNTWLADSMGLTRIQEKREILEKTLELLRSPAFVGEDTRTDEAVLLWLLGDAYIYINRKESIPYYQQALELLEAVDDRTRIGNLLCDMGGVLARISKYEEAKAILERSLDINREGGDKWFISKSLRRLASLMINLGDYEKAEIYLRETMAFDEELEYQRGFRENLLSLGRIQLNQGMFQEAEDIFNRSMEMALAEIPPRIDVVVNNFLAQVEILQGRYQEGFNRSQEMLPEAKVQNIFLQVGFSHMNFGMVAITEGDYEKGLQYLEKALEQYRSFEAIDLVALTLILFSHCHLGLSMIDDAKSHLQEALRIAIEIKNPHILQNAFPALALLSIKEGEVEQGLTFYAHAYSHNCISESQWFEDVIGKQLASVTEDAPPEMIASAQARGEGLDPWKTAQELLVEMEPSS
jgi:tetratricopeptide (TPR) repeat protein